MRVHALVLATLGLVLVGPAMAAAPQTVEEIANYTGADRAQLFEAGARKEGHLMLYTTGTQTDPIIDSFRARVPYIRIEVFRAGSADVTRRMIEEYKASKYIVDAINLNTGGLHPMLAENMLQPYISPEMAAFKAQAIEPGRHWVLDYESYVNLAYNTKEVAAADVPKTYDDLLDAKWKGKMALSNRGGTLEHWIGGVVLTKGEDFVRQLGKQDWAVYQISGRALSNMVVSGEVPISPVIFASHMINSQRKGATVENRFIGPTYASIGGAALARKANSPFAAMMYIDYVLSKDGQEWRLKIGNFSGRKDLENPTKNAEVIYLTERPNYEAEYDQWRTLGRQVFGAGKKLEGVKDTDDD
jgi:iron(III) transport system substrate-binding protein